MAYHLRGAQAHLAAETGKLTPVIEGLARVAIKNHTVLDSHYNSVLVPKGTNYHITGTKDGNGYVITIDSTMKTYYLTADVGCHLV